MMNRIKQYRTPLTTLFLALSICVGFRQIPYLLTKHAAYTLAYHLGYTVDKEISTWRRCTPSIALDALVAPQCAVIISYYTAVSAGEMQARMDSLGFPASKGVVDGNDLSFELRSTAFTINGIDTFDILRQQLLFTAGTLWYIRDTRNRSGEIRYYDIIHHTDDIYMVDNHVVSENITTIILWENR